MQLWPYPYLGDTPLLLIELLLLIEFTNPSQAIFPHNLIAWSYSQLCPLPTYRLMSARQKLLSIWKEVKFPSMSCQQATKHSTALKSFMLLSIKSWVAATKTVKHHQLEERKRETRLEAEVEKVDGSLKSDSPWKLRVNKILISNGAYGDFMPAPWSHPLRDLSLFSYDCIIAEAFRQCFG